MSDHVKNMIDAVVNQDAAAFMDNFETAINTKVAAKLDALYPEVAHSVMNPQAELSVDSAAAEQPEVVDEPQAEQ